MNGIKKFEKKKKKSSVTLEKLGGQGREALTRIFTGWKGDGSREKPRGVPGGVRHKTEPGLSARDITEITHGRRGCCRAQPSASRGDQRE